MEWQPGEGVSPGDPAGGTAAKPGQFTGFAHDGGLDGYPPSAALAAALEEGLAGTGASRDELVGMLRGWAALEAWASAGRLGALRALIRDEAPPASAGSGPSGWSKSLACEVAAALAVSVPTADSMLWLAQDLDERLPGTLGLLAAGDLTYAKARAVDEALQLLGEADSARAEAMILAELPGKNYGQVKRLAEQAAVTVDPDSAARRRDDAEREKARVQLFREDSGAAALSGRDLPTAQALAAHARVCARAQQYKDCGAFPGTRMDQLRAAAYLDLLNDFTADERIASGTLPASGAVGPASPDADGEPDAVPPEPLLPSPPGPAPARLTDLIVPLATLLGLAERPGEGHELGPLDPGLCRSLAELAVHSPHTSVCVTVTDPDGLAIGHGCARPAKRGKSPRTVTGQPGAALPGRLNLTIPRSRLAALSGSKRSPGQPWAFEDLGPPGGFGRWIMAVPGGRQLVVQLDEVPTYACDHRHESSGYQPGDRLRHLVQVRDGNCTFPPCTRQARESDFEHCVPYDQGGRTCACNAGARSRQCHRVKQSPGWNVTQPRPGWHQWLTPAGRTYTQGPKRYPS